MYECRQSAAVFYKHQQRGGGRDSISVHKNTRRPCNVERRRVRSRARTRTSYSSPYVRTAVQSTYILHIIPVLLYIHIYNTSSEQRKYFVCILRSVYSVKYKMYIYTRPSMYVSSSFVIPKNKKCSNGCGLWKKVVSETTKQLQQTPHLTNTAIVAAAPAPAASPHGSLRTPLIDKRALTDKATTTK